MSPGTPWLGRKLDKKASSKNGIGEASTALWMLRSLVQAFGEEKSRFACILRKAGMTKMYKRTTGSMNAITLMKRGILSLVLSAGFIV